MNNSRKRNLSFSPFCAIKRKGTVGVLRHPHSMLCVHYFFFPLLIALILFVLPSTSAAAYELEDYPGIYVSTPPSYYNDIRVGNLKNNELYNINAVYVTFPYWVVVFRQTNGVYTVRYIYTSNDPINITSGGYITCQSTMNYYNPDASKADTGVLYTSTRAGTTSSYSASYPVVISPTVTINGSPAPTPIPEVEPTIWEKIVGKGKTVSDFLVDVFTFLFDPDEFGVVEVGLGEPELPTPTVGPTPTPIPIKNPQGDIIYEIPQLPSSGNSYPDINTVINNSTDVVIPHEYSYSFDVGDDHYNLDVNGSFGDQIDGVEDFVTEISDGVKASGSLIAWIPDKYLALLGTCVVISIIFGVVNKMLE